MNAVSDMTDFLHTHQKICDDVTQLQIELDTTLQKFLEQAGHKIQINQQEALKQSVESTKQRLERLKSYYVCSP